MHQVWGLFIPLAQKNSCKPIKIKIDNFGMEPIKPYFKMMNEEETVRLFLNAICDSKEDPRVYLMREAADIIDLNEIRRCLDSASCYVSLKKAETKVPGDTKTNSILIKDGSRNSIFHLHMVREPGKDQWKIYGIEKE